MSQAGDTYISKMAALDTAFNSINDVIEKLRGFASPLIRNWHECIVQDPGRGIPMGMTNRPHVLHAVNFPSARQIADALVAHYEAEEAAKLAWDHLSEAEKRHMAPPYWAR